MDEIGIRHKLEEEVNRFNIFQRSVLNANEKIKLPTEADIKNYAKYILKEGSKEDKRLVLQNLKSEIYYANKKLELSKKVKNAKI